MLYNKKKKSGDIMEKENYAIKKISDKFSDSLYYVSVSDFKKGTLFRAHRHNYIEAELILSGKAINSINGKDEEVSKGLIYILRPADVHIFRAVTDISLIKIYLSETIISEEILNIIMSNETNLIKKLSDNEFLQIMSVFKILENDFNSEHKNERLMYNSVDSFFSIILRDHLEKSMIKDKDPLQAVLNYMQIHFAESPTLAEAASVIHYNPSYFSKFFHDKTSVTFSDYLNNLKISCAKKLLTSSNEKIIMIGEKCGFKSQSNFLRVFTGNVGMSPMDYRKKHGITI